MIDLQHTGVAGRRPVFPLHALILKDKAVRAGRGYVPTPLPSMEYVREPRKPYGKSRKTSTDTSDSKAAYPEDIFTRLDRLRSNASEDSVSEQLERLQGIAALMQQREQGPLPGELLRVYAWEVEDAVKIIKKNSEVRIQNSE